MPRAFTIELVREMAGSVQLVQEIIKKGILGWFWFCRDGDKTDGSVLFKKRTLLQEMAAHQFFVGHT